MNESNYDKPLHKLDTEEQTYGCRQKNPNICTYNCMNGVCAFVREDNLCKHPSRSWKNRFLSMKNVVDDSIPCIFLRLSNFFEHDYIEEHIKCDKKYGYVWMLKLGRIINKDYLKKVIEKHGGVIMKTPSKNDTKYYYADLISIDPEPHNIKYPDYYNEIFEYDNYEIDDLIKNNNWFKISNIREIPIDLYDKFIISKNDSNLFEVADSCRTPYMYVKKEKNTEL